MTRLQMLALAALTSCSTLSVAEEPASATNASIQAFIDICVKQAPTFAGAAEAAKVYGITEVSESGGTQSGMTADYALAVQIRENQSCTITTDVQKDKKLTRQLIDAVAKQTGEKLGTRLPLGVVLGGERFALTHDRAGGEAFVLLKVK